MNADPDLPLRPPVGRTGRAETGRQSYSIEAVNEFDSLFEDIYEYCEMQADIETLIHEVGAAQMEINFVHGDALSLADQVFLFKRTVREAALRHNMYATFMAKPMQDEPETRRCTSTRAQPTRAPGATCSPTRTVRCRRCSTTISRGCRSTRPH